MMKRAALLVAAACAALAIGQSAFADDLKKEVKIVGYVLGDAPQGLPAIAAEMNKKTKADLNASVEFNYIGWGDLAAKYPLLLAAGQDVDWIFTANWCRYFESAAKGAFMEITDDMLKKYMPKYYATQGKVALQQAKINGKLYMLPTTSPDKKIDVAIIRGDLRKKYGIPEIKRWSEIEPYLAAIKAREPDMVPIYADNTFDVGRPMNYYYDCFAPILQDPLAATGSGTGLGFTIQETGGKLYSMFDEPYISAFKKAAKVMKSWYEKGYINKDVLANKVRSKEAFAQGKSAVGFGNSIDIQQTLTDCLAKGYEVEIIPDLDNKGRRMGDSAISNGVAIPASARNPERTMMFLDRLMEDKSYNYLIYFGIEGKHYTVKDGKIALNTAISDYPVDAAGFWFTDKNQFLPLSNWTPQYAAVKSDIAKKGYVVDYPLSALNIDTTAIKNEVAAVNQVLIQYYQPIEVGMVPDVDAALKAMQQKLKAAGVDAIQAECQRQINAYLAASK